MRILRMILIAATLSSTGACLVTARGGTSSGRPVPGQPGATVSGVVSDARTRALISQAAVDIVDVTDTNQKVNDHLDRRIGPVHDPRGGAGAIPVSRPP